jgi:hypothetical protein
MVAEHERVEPERIVGNRRVHGALPAVVVYRERFAAAPALDLILAAAADEVVVARVEWKQYPEVPAWISVEHQQVAVLTGANLHLGTITREEPAIVADPDLNGWVVAPWVPDRCGARGSESKKRKE